MSTNKTAINRARIHRINAERSALEAQRRRYHESLIEEYQPVGALEVDLVQALADTAWRLKQVLPLETQILSLGLTSGASPATIAAFLNRQLHAVSNLSLHSERLTDQFIETERMLRKIKAERSDSRSRAYQR